MKRIESTLAAAFGLIIVASGYARAGTATEREVTFQNGEVVLAGTLVLPEGKGPHPAVVIVHGSGPNDRSNWQDQTAFFHAEGIALLKFDKRGGGKSGGSWTDARMEDLARDALSGVDFLAGQPEIDPKRIGLWGGSQGWTVAGLAASMDKRVAFVVMVSGYAGTLWDQESYAQKLRMRLDGRSPAEIKRFDQVRARFKKVLVTGKGYAAIGRDLAKKPFESILPYLFRGGVMPPENHPVIQFWRLNHAFDPMQHLAGIRCPVLSLWGAKDDGVPAAQAAADTRALFDRSGHPDATVGVFPDADHGLYHRLAPGPGWAPKAERALVPGYQELVARWVRNRVGL